MSRFKTDENIHPDAAGLLRRYGHDALTIWDQKLQGNIDSKIADVCRIESRALITYDLGFADIRVYPPNEFAGLIVLRIASQSRASTLGAMERLMPIINSRNAEGQLWIVDEKNVRIRGTNLEQDA